MPTKAFDGFDFSKIQRAAARKARKKGAEHLTDDLEQEVVCSILERARYYDETKSAKSTFAYRISFQVITEYINQNISPAKLPKRQVMESLPETVYVDKTKSAAHSSDSIYLDTLYNQNHAEFLFEEGSSRVQRQEAAKVLLRQITELLTKKFGHETTKLAFDFCIHGSNVIAPNGVNKDRFLGKIRQYLREALCLGKGEKLTLSTMVG